MVGRLRIVPSPSRRLSQILLGVEIQFSPPGFRAAASGLVRNDGRVVFVMRTSPLFLSVTDTLPAPA